MAGIPGAGGRPGSSGSYRGSVTAAQALRQLQELHDSEHSSGGGNSGSGNSTAECESLRAALEATRQELLDVYEQVTSLPSNGLPCHHKTYLGPCNSVSTPRHGSFWVGGLPMTTSSGVVSSCQQVAHCQVEDFVNQNRALLILEVLEAAST